MPNSAFRKVLIIGLLSMLGLISYQAYLFTNYSKLSQRQQEDNIVAALYQSVDDLYQINPEAGKILNPVRKLSEGYYRVQVNDTLHPYLLENLLAKNFEQHNLGLPFEYAIYDCFTDSTVFASQVNPSIKRKKSEYLENLSWKSDGHYFGVYFPTLPNAWLNIPEVLKLSSILLALLLVFFGYTLFVVLREKRLQNVKTDFINNVTHQLKTPVSALVLSINALEIQKEKIPYFQVLKKETQQLKQIIEQVLLLSKLASKNHQTQSEAINIKAYLKAWSQSKGRSISLDFKIAEHAAAIADPSLLQTVLDNLYDNTVNHNEADVLMGIQCREEAGWMALRYWDEGKGIPKNQRKNVFNKFYSASINEPNKPRKGFGLGLFIARESLKRMKGQIHLLESKSGVLFQIKLPKP